MSIILREREREREGVRESERREGEIDREIEYINTYR